MDFNKYKIIITPRVFYEMNKIYEYIAKELYAIKAAKNLGKKVNEEIYRLEHSPYLYQKINKTDEEGRLYRRIVVKNYIILYIVEEKEKEAYVSRMHYGRRNYLGNNRL